MLIPLRTRKSWRSRCFGCKVHKRVRHVFLGMKKFVGSNSMSKAVLLFSTKEGAAVHWGSEVRVYMFYVPEMQLLQNFPELSRVHVPKLCRSRCLSTHWSWCPSARQDGRGQSPLELRLGWNQKHWSEAQGMKRFRHFAFQTVLTQKCISGFHARPQACGCLC